MKARPHCSRKKNETKREITTHLAVAERVTDTEDAAVEAEEAVVAAPIANSGVSAKTSVMLPMFTASMV